MTYTPSNEAKAAIEAVQIAGKKLKDNFGKAAEANRKSSSAVDAVTKLDVETETFLYEYLKKHYPSIGFKGEEAGSIDISKGKFWLTDPIDGTAYFIRGVPGCTTMVALVENGEVKIGIIYDFVNDDLYFAERGRGAYLNKKPIHVSDRDPKSALLSVECRITNEVLPQFLALDKTYNIVEAGYPSGNQHALVARGQLEGRICLNPYGNDYDFAPGSLLIQEAGGIVANFGKTTYKYTDLNFMAVNKPLFTDLTSGKDAIFPLNG